MFTHLTPSHFPITWNYQNILSIVRFKLYRSTFEPIVFFSLDIESIVSYLGIMMHLNANKLKKEIFDKNGWDFNP